MKYLFILITLVLLSLSSTAQDAGALRKKHFNLENGLAIKGYDPVAYFTQNQAVKGKKELAVSYQGILYYFSSEANKEAFKAAPFKYEPEYGGCVLMQWDKTARRFQWTPKPLKY